VENMFNVILKGHNFEYEVGELLKAFGILDFSFVLKDFKDKNNRGWQHCRF
jgi:hypothetical protein